MVTGKGQVKKSPVLENESFCFALCWDAKDSHADSNRLCIWVGVAVDTLLV